MRVTWMGFLRSQRRNPTARVLVAMGGDCSQRMEERLRQRFRAKRIDAESFELRLQELLRLRAEFARSRPVCGELYDASEWEELGNGAYRRRALKGV